MADTFVAEQLNSINVGQILMSPVFELAKAQGAFAAMIASYIKEVCLNADGSAKMVRLGAELTKRNAQSEVSGSDKVVMDAWMGELAPPPFTRLTRMRSKFGMNVSAVTGQASETSGSATLEAKAGFGWWGASLKATVASSSKSTRTTDTRARIDCDVEYTSGDPPEVYKLIMAVLRSQAMPTQADKAPALPAPAKAA